jgi:hypothetical protein
VFRSGEKEAARQADPAEKDASRRRGVADLSKLPLYFIENQGQVDRRVSFYARGARLGVYFTPGGLAYVISGDSPRREAEPIGRLALRPAAFDGARPAEANDQTRRWALKLEFVGASDAARPEGLEPTPAVVSYFKGSPEHWKTGLSTYAKVMYRDLWPGIDLVYTGAGGRLKSTFIVHPGADPSRIRLAWQGAEELRVNAQGQLEVSTPAGQFQEERPYAYQELADRQVEIPSAYRLESANTYRFELGAYDPTRPLVVDPVTLAYFFQFGGSNSDDGNSVAVGSFGTVYVTGETYSSDFPATSGPLNSYTFGGDAFVAKVNSSGTALIYAAFLGGSCGDSGAGIAVDSAGYAYVAGRTCSSNFPVYVGPDLTHNGAYDAFAVKLNLTGTALVYSGFIGGSALNGDFGYGIALDALRNAYVTGSTYSSDFPTTSAAYDRTFNGGRDAFVAKVRADGSGLVYSTFLGGSENDDGKGIAVDSSGNAYVTGPTASSNFPATAGAYDTSHNGGSDAFVAKLDKNGSNLVYASFLGGSVFDGGNGIALDSGNNAYVAGVTDSSDFPTTSGAYDTSHNGSADAFVAKLHASGASLVYATFLGGSNNDGGSGIAVDSEGNA